MDRRGSWRLGRVVIVGFLVGLGAACGLDATGNDGQGQPLWDPNEADACALDVDLSGECPAQGDDCNAGDFVCMCHCGCETGVPGEPGIYQCHYQVDGLLQPGPSQVVIDCAAGTVAAELGVTVENNGTMAVGVRLLAGGVGFVGAGGEPLGCGGLCADGFCETESAELVGPGESRTETLSVGPGPCPDNFAASLCDLCGGTATATIFPGVFSEGPQGSLPNFELTDIPIVCP